MEYPYSLVVKLDPAQYELLRREAESQDILTNDLVKGILRAYAAQKTVPALDGLTLPELVCMIQSGEIQ